MEFVILLPLLGLVLALVIAAGRLAGNRQEVHDAAHQAARAATQARDPGAAQRQAVNAAHSALAGAGASCRDVNVVVDTTQFRPGGVVRVRITCTVALDDVVPLGIPGDKTLSADATSPIDAYRGGGTNSAQADRTSLEG